MHESPCEQECPLGYCWGVMIIQGGAMAAVESVAPGLALALTSPILTGTVQKA